MDEHEKILEILHEHTKKLENIEKILSSKPIIKEHEQTKPVAGFESLAEKCSVDVNQLKDLIRVKGKKIEILVPLTGNTAKKQATISLCLMAAHEEIFGADWLSSNIISECCRSSGVIDKGNNLSTNLKTRSDLFRKSTTANEYMLTSGLGHKTAYETIHNLIVGH